MLAGALAVLVVALVAWNVSLRGDADGAREVAVVASADAPSARGRVVIRDDGTATVRVTGLPELPPRARLRAVDDP